MNGCISWKIYSSLDVIHGVLKITFQRVSLVPPPNREFVLVFFKADDNSSSADSFIFLLLLLSSPSSSSKSPQKHLLSVQNWNQMLYCRCYLWKQKDVLVSLLVIWVPNPLIGIIIKTCISIKVEARSSIVVITRCFVPPKPRLWSWTILLNCNLSTSLLLPTGWWFSSGLYSLSAHPTASNCCVNAAASIAAAAWLRLSWCPWAKNAPCACPS